MVLIEMLEIARKKLPASRPPLVLLAMLLTASAAAIECHAAANDCTRGISW